jgi:hypothetical protein
MDTLVWQWTWSLMRTVSTCKPALIKWSVSLVLREDSWSCFPLCFAGIGLSKNLEQKLRQYPHRLTWPYTANDESDSFRIIKHIFFCETLIRQIHLYIATHQVSSPTKAPLFPKLPKWLHSYIVKDKILTHSCRVLFWRLDDVCKLGLVEEVFPVSTDTNPFSWGLAHWAAWRPRTMMRRDIILPRLTFSFYLLPVSARLELLVIIWFIFHFSSSFLMLWLGMKTLRIFSDRIRYRIRLEGF